MKRTLVMSTPAQVGLWRTQTGINCCEEKAANFLAAHTTTEHRERNATEMQVNWSVRTRIHLLAARRRRWQHTQRRGWTLSSLLNHQWERSFPFIRRCVWVRCWRLRRPAYGPAHSAVHSLLAFGAIQCRSVPFSRLPFCNLQWAAAMWYSVC